MSGSDTGHDLDKGQNVDQRGLVGKRHGEERDVKVSRMTPPQSSKSPMYESTTAKSQSAMPPRNSDGRSVQETRKLLLEIRNLGTARITRDTRLSNGELVHEFAFKYVRSTRKRRQASTKASKARNQN
jgi:hypothetical protein